ncbi:ROK family protein [Sphingomonas aliaeris]|uniref:fructokinase n=1 Tax=Sphingomonas aliaeris TaxID=2759526 RepID=A0A974S4J0_9SPHN|nr:ROK family protein [Sphingomonas aliaeris]QQV77638.1 ROK family protein [Sphingomonas aliaeris]
MIDAPVAIDTDVQCAALAELRNGAGIGLDRLCYVTIGTGIGVGYADRHRMDTDGSRPEAGHIRVPRAPGDEGFAGACPYHHDCLEGLACGPAMAERWDVAAENLPDDHPGWDHQAHYAACLCVNLTYSVRPDRIVLGGGVMERPGLHDRVRAQFDRMMAGYALDRRSADPATFIAPPVLNEPSPGLVGALMLARTVRADDR